MKNPDRLHGAEILGPAQRRLLRTMERWHCIQSRVGGVGIALSHAFSSSIIHNGSEESFRGLVDALVTLKSESVVKVGATLPSRLQLPPIQTEQHILFARIAHARTMGQKATHS